ncbi:PAS domain S-box-containing protein [Kineococcus xinjiangensis]|uniref:PAS domain S-box-containing protein n=1 Tax=Kineococcus xinjiangensis TaxID=512762 RepID=A0A2S6IF56_9ACTN|nr:ATP-binding protein [Kineococcus xinjiangensis]PPK92855.1 PAS domain S-box-containing protein [Kineococcus xinjiangensis]
MSSRSLLLAPVPEAPGQARRWLAQALLEAGRQECLDAAELALSEVVTNVALHARTPAEVSVAVQPDGVRVEVRDFNSVIPMQRHYGQQASTGRGMALVASITDSCGVTPLADGKIVWFVVVPPAAEPSVEDLLALWDEEQWELPEGVDLVETAVQHAPSEQTRQVRLLAIPPLLWMAARQHHDALLRELALYAAVREDVVVDFAGVELARQTFSNAIIAAIADAQRHAVPPSASAAHHEAFDGHLPEAPEPFDLHLALHPEVGPAAAALQDALDAAERLAAGGELLAFPGQPEIIAVRDWVCEQVQSQLQSQLEGVAARPWPGAAQERFETAQHPHHLRRGDGHGFGAAVDVVSASEAGVVAADEGDRIVAVSRGLAAALGWDVTALVGRRIVTLVPPRLREAHIAAFSRHLSTGQSRIVGAALTLPVLHADGREVLCSFRLEQRPAPAGRSLYLAWIDPLPGTATTATA